MIVPTYETTAREQEIIINNQRKEIERLNKENKILRENAEHNDKVVDKVNWENKRLDNIINELEKCVQNYIYAIEPRGCSINYNCEYDSEEDYINAMKEQSKLNTFKFILNKIKELKGDDSNENL